MHIEIAALLLSPLVGVIIAITVGAITPECSASDLVAVAILAAAKWGTICATVYAWRQFMALS